MSTAAPGEQLPILELRADEHARGLGVLAVLKETERVRLPLSNVSISAAVADRVASVTIEQKFRNTFSDHLEAVYIFPISAGCAVSRFEMKVGARIVKGIIQERGEARRQYQQALDDGKRAALLEQDRDDVFTVQVGNLPPGEEVTVSLTYSERLPYFEDGKTELRLPLVVAPRYISGEPVSRDPVGSGIELDTDVVPDASRISPPRLAKGLDPKVELKLAVELMQDTTAGGASLSDLVCSQHATRTGMDNGSLKVELARTDERLDRDFVLQWRLVAEKVKSSVLVHRDEDGSGYAMLSIFPPKRGGYLGAARDVIFVLDRSGSMQGMKMTSAARACSILLETLGPNDCFAIQAFDNVVEWLKPPRQKSAHDVFQYADEAGQERGQKYLRAINSRGGTELDGAIGSAFEVISHRSASDGRVPVVVVLTDGEVGDESRILKRIQTELGDARLFAVGIDTSVNDGLLRRVANLGGGTATFVQPGTQLEDALLAVGREIGSPLVVDLEIEAIGGKLEQDTIAPARIPDLFSGRAVTAFFRINGKGKVRVKGTFNDGTAFDESVKLREIDLPAVAQLWAKTHIMDLEDQFRVKTDKQAELRELIVKLAVKHSLLTRFTAFVAVDEREIVNAGGDVRKVVQPVENPAGWDMLEEDQLVNGSMNMRFRALGAMPQALFNRSSIASQGADAQWGSAPPPAQAPQAPPPGSSGWGQPSPSSQSPMKMGKWLDAGMDALGKVMKKERSGKPSDNKEVTDANREFSQALEKAWQEIKSGVVPKAADLENARKALMKVLSTCDIGSEVPLFQKFLRGAAVELIASLKDRGADPAVLMPIWERHVKAFEAAQAELTGVLSGSTGGGSTPFWESTV